VADALEQKIDPAVARAAAFPRFVKRAEGRIAIVTNVGGDAVDAGCVGAKTVSQGD
jgi:hypothetical protein